MEGVGGSSPSWPTSFDSLGESHVPSCLPALTASQPTARGHGSPEGYVVRLAGSVSGLQEAGEEVGETLVAIER
jgi:hypothetical protein